MPWLARPDGCRLFFETHGDGAPLVLLEGMGGDIAGWRRNIPRLAERLRVVAWDLRGNGRSVCEPGGWTMETFVLDTVALLDHLEIERAHLYGQSLGGMIAIETALAHPGRVRSLVLAATHAGRAVPSRERAPKDRPWELLYAPGFPERHPDHVADDLAHGSAQPPAARRAQWEATKAWDAHDRLGEIAAPTLVVHGTEDRMIHPDNGRVLAERIPGARLALLEGAGHAYHSEQADPADRLVLEFVLGVA